MKQRIFLSLGSNLGNRAANLIRAAEYISARIGPVTCSDMYATDPRYIRDQPQFINMAIATESERSPEEILESTQDIETAMGRNRISSPRKGPRVIDIDILLYGGHIVDTEELVIPHPGIRERKFVLIPLLELDPALTDPVSGTPYREYLEALRPQGIYYFTLKRYSQAAHGG